jgi:hypothetical protein
MDKFFAGCFVGMAVFMIMLGTFPGSMVKQVNEAIAECEKSLPRDQHCKFVALPVSKD